MFGYENEKVAEVVLADKNKYLLKPGNILIVDSATQTGDWKTANARNIPYLRKGTKVKFIKYWSNFYGWWVTVVPLRGQHNFEYDLRAENLL